MAFSCFSGFTHGRAKWLALIVLFLAAVVAVAADVVALTVVKPEPAYADSLAVASTRVSNTVVTTTAKEQKAYNRAVRACMDYQNMPNPIVVDMSDLKLTAKQAKNVWTMIHTNGELFWINCYNDTYTRTTFTLPCRYDDEAITKMRRELDTVVDKALKRLGPGMSKATKVHMLHDFLIDRAEYAYDGGYKTAYATLVQKKGDCFGYALAMDVLFRRAGFSTDIALNESIDHSWNLVKVDGKWYHVDVAWDETNTGKNYDANFNWSKKRCHLYLLQSDASMMKETTDPATGSYMVLSHTGWTCHHKCTTTTHDFLRTLNKDFYKHCNDYKSIVRSFSKGGLKYQVIGVKKIKLVGVNASKRKVKTLSLPATVKYRNVTYNVTGIAAKTLSIAKAKTLRVASTKLTKVSVKNSLASSKVRTIKLIGSAVKKKSAYKQYFKKANSGKSVAVK